MSLIRKTVSIRNTLEGLQYSEVCLNRSLDLSQTDAGPLLFYLMKKKGFNYKQRRKKLPYLIQLKIYQQK